MWGCAAILLCLAVCAQAAPGDYLPLQVGNRWEYATTGTTAVSIVEIVATEQIKGTTWYRYNTGVRIRLDEKGRLVSWNEQKSIAEVLVDFQGPDGTVFSTTQLCSASGSISHKDNRITVSYTPSCADAGIAYETYTSGIGVTESAFTTIAGPRTRRLVRARIAGKDLTF